MRQILKSRNIAHYFIDVFGSPEKKILHMNNILSDYNFNPDELIFYGDSNSDLDAAENLNIDFEKIRKMMIDNYPRAKNIPKAGFAAGPCLYKDTVQLNTFFKNNFFLGNSAIKINEGLPRYIVKKLSLKYNLKNKVVGILGMAFKANIDDSRNSLSYKLRKILKSR